MSQLCVALHNIPATRQQQLDAWFVLSGKTKRSVARALGYTTQHFGMILSGSRMTDERRAQLVAFGIPAELLPESEFEPKRGATGCDQERRAGQDRRSGDERRSQAA